MKIRLRESSGLGRPRLDKANCCVRGVKILGHESAHGHKYAKEAMLEAIPLYEGRQVNVNHPTKGLGTSRRYEDRFGRLKNVEYREGKGLFGDLHYNGGHRLRKQFEFDVEHEPKNCGLSHNASGSAKKRNGDVIVESIDKVRSVDLVADPATNVSLFEDKGGRSMLRARKKRRTSREDRKRIFQRRLMEAIAAEGEEEGSSVPTPREAMAKMVMAIFMDDSLDAKQRKDKINKLLDMEEDVSSDEGDGDEPSGEKEKEVPEDRGERPRKKGGRVATKKKKGRLLESVADVASELKAMKKERRVLDLCESVGFKPRRTELKALMGLGSKDEVKELIESMSDKRFERPAKKGSKKSVKPRSRSSHDVDDEDDGDSKTWLEGLTD